MEELIKKRTIKVTGMTCEGCESKINDALLKLDGVRNVKAEKTGTVQVEYDLMKIKLAKIEDTIESLGYKMKSNLMDKIKRDFVHDSEQNEYDNMTRPDAPCCSNPDKLLDQSK